MAEIVFSANRKFWWPVTVYRAEDGEFVAYQFKARFEALQPGELKEASAGEKGVDQILRDHVIDWEGPKDEDGKSLSFSAEALESALSDIDVRRGLIEALMDASSGEAARKNSKTPHG